MAWLFWIIALLISAGAAYWVFRADKVRAVPYPWLTALLRGLVVFLAALLLLAPVFTITRNETQKPIILFLQDNSASIAPALGKDSTVYRQQATDLLKRLSENYKVVQWGFGSTVSPDSIFDYKKAATDISASLTQAQEYFSLQNLGAVILASDGRFNQGANPLYQQLSLNSPLYTVAIGDSAAQKDIRVSHIHANKIVSLNSQFEIRADVIATLCKGYDNNVSLSENGKTIAVLPVSISSDRYDRSASFSVKAESTGLHHYTIAVPSVEGEKNTANNKRDIFVEVSDEKKNILILSAAPHPDVNAIKEALVGLETYKVTLRTADNLPASFAGYDVIILHQLPSLYNNLQQLLSSAKKPVWYILGSQSNPTALSQLQNLATLGINPGPLRDALPVLSPAFNAFNLPQNIQSVLDKMPPIAVPMGKIQAAPNALVLFSQKQVYNNIEMPLWALQQGNVPTAMLMGEGLWRWRLYEYKNFNRHDVIDECIRQTVAFLAANVNERPFRVLMPKYIWSDQEAISLNAYLLNANKEQVNTPDAELTISDSAGKKQKFSFERSGNAYKLNLGVWAGGNYTYTARCTYNGTVFTSNGSFTIESTPLEFMESGADYPLLYNLAKKYNGSIVPSKNIASLYDTITHNEHIKPVIQTITDTVPLIDRKWYFFLILLIAAAEWLLRKYWLAQ